MPVQSNDDQGGVDVSILVVSYNTALLTLEALRSVFAETRDVSFEVIVVDNCSDDRSAEAIRAAFPSVRLIALKKNIGFASANNLASTHARGRYILLLNPDTVVLDRAIDNIVAFARAMPDARIWGGRTLFKNGDLNPSSCWGSLTLWRLACRASGLDKAFKGVSLFNGEAYGGWNRDSERRVDIVSGCFFLIERELWGELGGFAPIFFMYGEEADLCMRARAMGATPMVTPEATIVHIGGASDSVRNEKMIKLLAAKATLIERHFVGAARPVGLMLLLAWPASRAFASTVMAALTNSDRWKTGAANWMSIWRARSEWWQGYPLRVIAARGARGMRGNELPAA